MSYPTVADQPARVLYHHRTQGKAVEGVHIRGIADALRADDVAVDIISLPGADPYVSPKKMSPTQQARPWMKWVVSLPEPLFELAELGYNLVAGWRLWIYLATHRDVGFIYERYALFMFVTVLIGRLRGLPVILEINDSSTVDRVRPLCFQRLATAIERWVLSRASGLVFVSGVFRQRVMKAHGGLMTPAIVTHNAANIDKFSFTAEQRRLTREQWGLADGEVVCGYLGAFVPWHAIDQFVYRIADDLPEHPHLKLLLVGDGATFDTVQRFVRERGLERQVLLTGRVSHDEVPGLLAAMDMAVLPSAGDYTSPVKLFEFMACGIPPIAPDFEPIREVVREQQTGWMFPAGDLNAAVDAVLLRSTDLQRLQQVGQAARSYIESERQWRHNILQLLAFWRRVR
ncbi:glycosyltransferase involved in cell wall biosynthesis [Sphaerotilus hippei]|uniref:Glycosyltransferase involved in cell wall biosynthesis n=1 Tax=Sphaerotilus hippei TaxID=744406 RepID=A0A318GZK8_9BURK|nr:glycosyltransferase family 4 protein [Sphaerotilus hippei]PXW95556.1 glycosyltransferase involved in cell wall biosynthesis [Sphaerotilus hippei]